MALLAIEEAEDPDEFVALEIKAKINKFSSASPNEKIPANLLNEAVRWRLGQNDCQNRGYILDGYPFCYETANGVFYITPEAPPKKPVVTDENGEEAPAEEEPIDPEELAKMMAPKFQKHIYPDSTIYLRGDDDFIRKRAANLDKAANLKWDRENLERRLTRHRENNDINLFFLANNRADLGHPKAKPAKYPLNRFFQEHKTEVFEIEADGNSFEMFEGMRVYIERNGRAYNYLPSVENLNQEREKYLVKEEAQTKKEKEEEKEKSVIEEKGEREALEKLQD